MKVTSGENLENRFLAKSFLMKLTVCKKGVMLWEQRVVGSNPAAPTKNPPQNQSLRRRRSKTSLHLLSTRLDRVTHEKSGRSGENPENFGGGSYAGMHGRGGQLFAVTESLRLRCLGAAMAPRRSIARRQFFRGEQ
jgi:hypothetical protein